MKKKDKKRLRSMQERISYFDDMLHALQRAVGRVEGRTAGMDCPVSEIRKACPLDGQPVPLDKKPARRA
jgi:hypothetical protein